VNFDILDELTPIFHPRAVAIIGASNREGNFGRRFADALRQMGFEKLYVVHPYEKEVLGITAYPAVREIPEEIDLAVVVSPPHTVLQVVRECADEV